MVSLSSCVFNPKKLDVHIINVAQGTCTQYKITETKPEIKFEEIKDKPLIECDEMFAVPLEQGLEMKRAWEAEHQKGN